MSRWRRQQRKRAGIHAAVDRAFEWVSQGAIAALERDFPDTFVPKKAEANSGERPSASEFRAALEAKVAEVRSLGLGPPFVPPDGVRPVLLETSDPSRFNLVFVKEENN